MPFFQPFKSSDRFANSAGEVMLEYYDYSGDNLVYQGACNNPTGSTSAEIWAIAKYTYTDNKCTRVEYRYMVAWDDRALLDWL